MLNEIEAKVSGLNRRICLAQQANAAAYLKMKELEVVAENYRDPRSPRVVEPWRLLQEMLADHYTYITSLRDRRDNLLLQNRDAVLLARRAQAN